MAQQSSAGSLSQHTQGIGLKTARMPVTVEESLWSSRAGQLIETVFGFAIEQAAFEFPFIRSSKLTRLS